MIAQHVWGLDFDPESNIIDVYVGYVRRKIDAEGERRLLHTVRGAGYMLSADGMTPPRSRPLSIRTRLTLWYGGLLLGILIVISVLGYSVLRFGLVQDLDASLLTVAQVLRDTSVSTEGPASEAEVETILRELLGADFYDKFFQFLDPEGRPAPRPSQPPSRALLLSPLARANAIRGRETFETVKVDGADDVRLLTMPIVRDGRVTQIVQVGMSLRRAGAALRRYVARARGAHPARRGAGRRRGGRDRAQRAPAGRRDGAGGAPDHRRGSGPAHLAARHRETSWTASPRR